MNKIFTLIITMLVSGYVAAQQVKLVSQVPNAIQLSNTVPDFTPSAIQHAGRSYQDFSKVSKVLMMQKDAPALPVYTGSIIIPNEGKVTLVVDYGTYKEFDNIEILPSKGSLKRNVNPAAIPYNFGAVYQQDAFFPGHVALQSEPYILRDKRGVTVSFFPYQYNPVTKKLRLYKNIAVKVVTNPAEAGENEIRRGSGNSGSAFGPIYQSQFLNADEYQQVPENGEMLIVAPDEYMEVMEPLAEWKRQKGIKTTLIPLSEAGFTASGIKATINSFYQANAGLTYVLLVGDHENLPSHSYGSSGFEELWSDSYYGQLSGNDFFPEVMVGRFSGNPAEVSLMVARTLEYEKTPLAGNWMGNCVGIGSNEGYGYGDDGQPDWEHLREIGNKLTFGGYNYSYEFFDSSQGFHDADGDPSAQIISDAINAGTGIINYCGHGDVNLFVTGFYTSNNVRELYNNGMYPFVVSVACNNGTFIGGTSLCEEWLRSENETGPAGAIAACGSSILMAWAEPMQTQDEMASLIAGDNPLNTKSTLGGLFYNGQMSVLEAYSLSPTAVEVMQTWVFFGDPSVSLRTAESQPLVATHNNQIPANATNITVDCNIEGAQVAITQNGVIIGTGIVTGGHVTINLGEFAADTALTVTVTGTNYIPYQGTVQVGTMGVAGLNAASVMVYPNPAHDVLNIKLASDSNATIELRDITGKIVYTAAMEGSHKISTSHYASGVYILTISSDEGRIDKKVIIN